MRALAVATLVLAVLVTGCSGDPGAADPAASPAASPSPTGSRGTPAGSPSASPSDRAATAAPSVPAPPSARDDRAGRETFAAYVLQAWIHALNTNDPQPLLAVSGARPCDGCRELAAELRSRAREGWYVDLADVRVRSTRVTDRGGTARVEMSVSLPESTTYFADGTFRSTNPAHPRRTFEVEMTFTGRRFRLDAFGVL